MEDPGAEDQVLRVLEARRIRKKKKKHCTDDLREQADRSATSSALAVVQAPGNTLTSVAAPLQLSLEANAIVAAVNGALALRLDGIQGLMGMLAGQMSSLKTDVVQLSVQVQQHDQRMSDFDRQLNDTTAGRSCGSGTASSAASSEPHPELARGNGSMHPPRNQRTLLVVGGFPCDTERAVISEFFFLEIFGHEAGVKDWWTPG